MLDIYKGVSCVIGFIVDLGDKVIFNIVGVDIGCGMLIVNLGKIEIDLEKLDKIIYEDILLGMNVYDGRVVRFLEL